MVEPIDIPSREMDGPSRCQFHKWCKYWDGSMPIRLFRPAGSAPGFAGFGEIFGKEFQCDETTEFGVLSLVNNFHAAATEPMRVSEAAILGCEVGQVNEVGKGRQAPP